MKRFLLSALLAATAPLAAPGAPGGRVAGSKHDLSVGGPGPIRAVSEDRVCIFCHVSHGSGGEVLVNRPDPSAVHVPYESSSLRGRARTPTGATRICLSCHDGTIALGQTRTGRIEMGAAAPGGRLPPGSPSNLGTDLRSTHPVSIVPSDPRRTRRPPPHGEVALDHAGMVQCTSCHDPHDELATPEGMFLVRPTRGSDLCLVCHEMPGLAASSHFSSPAPARGARDASRSVAEAGCGACHRSHDTDRGGRLLARSPEEDEDALCLRCHGTGATRADVGRDLSKPWSHAVPARGTHDAAEGPDGRRRLPEVSATAPRHAVCADCHDPHAANGRASLAPSAGGALEGAWGIDLSGRRVDPARFQYEVCLKCHGDSANKPQTLRPTPPETARRALVDVNLRRVFDPSAPSFHPVAAPGRNPDVPGLLPPWSTASLVLCTDCHASDAGPGAGGSGARGPHGSVYPHILERDYRTADFTVESPFAYALCYKCHDRETLFAASPDPSRRSGFWSAAAGSLHRLHVRD
ncbi:MAG TPA: cytochrome c3 family protein, partial [Anaeromyxobacteraceae bacterium]|nr:cytochrome c3 family protein [Anaeromyxobacteraceae bacterium]